LIAKTLIHFLNNDVGINNEKAKQVTNALVVSKGNGDYSAPVGMVTLSAMTEL